MLLGSFRQVQSRQEDPPILLVLPFFTAVFTSYLLLDHGIHHIGYDEEFLCHTSIFWSSPRRFSLHLGLEFTMQLA